MPGSAVVVDSGTGRSSSGATENRNHASDEDSVIPLDWRSPSGATKGCNAHHVGGQGVAAS